MDSAGKTQTYKAKNQDINGFGFILDSNRYDYALKRTDDYGAASFLLIKETGKKLNLYYSSYYVSVNGGASYRTDVYLLEDAGKRIVRVSGGLFSAYKKKIREFLKESPELLSIFERKVSSISDIPDFVREANQLL